MKEIISDPLRIAKCGLYCGSCGKFLKDKCPGCTGNDKASWCMIRTCCMENGYASCARCSRFDRVMECKKFNNGLSRIIGFVFRSDRSACIGMIRDKGYVAFAEYMAGNRLISLPRKAKQ